jgi:hypothetical protein
MNSSSDDRRAGRRIVSRTPFAVFAIIIYIFGGICTFGGLGYLFWRRWLDGGAAKLDGLGMIVAALGLFLSILGVLLMRIVRNRRFR